MLKEVANFNSTYFWFQGYVRLLSHTDLRVSNLPMEKQQTFYILFNKKNIMFKN